MTVKGLKEMLESYDDDQTIVMQQGDFAYEIGCIAKGYGVRTPFGKDYPALIISANWQLGRIWDVEDLDL